MSLLQTFIKQIIETSIIEWISVICGLLYVILIAKKKISGWLFGIIGSITTIYLCYIANYYLEMFLSGFYVIMGIWGWISWNKNSLKKEVKIIRWPIYYHFINITISGIITLVVGYWFEKNTNQSQPYLDAFTTIYSLTATFMVTKRVLENWIYWIVIDLVSIQLYASKDYFMLATLMALYSFLAVLGYINWHKHLKKNTLY